MSPESLCSILDGFKKNLLAYLLQGFTHGFQIGCVGLPPQRGEVVSNLKSADEFAEVIDRKIARVGIGSNTWGLQRSANLSTV